MRTQNEVFLVLSKSNIWNFSDFWHEVKLAENFKIELNDILGKTSFWSFRTKWSSKWGISRFMKNQRMECFRIFACTYSKTKYYNWTKCFFWGGNVLVVGLKWDQIEVFWIFCSFFAESYSSIQCKLKNEVLDFFGKNLVLRSLDRVGPKERFSSIIKNQGTFHNFYMKA